MKRAWLTPLILFLLGLVACKQPNAPHNVEPQQIVRTEKGISVSNIPETVDTFTVINLLKQSNVVMQRSLDSGLYINYKILALSRQLHYDKGMVKALMYIGAYTVNVKKQYKKAKAIFLEAIPYCSSVKNGDSIWMSKLYSNLGIAYTRENAYDSALWYDYQSLSVIKAEKKIDSPLMTTVYSNIGGLLAITNQNDQALYYLQYATALAKATKDTMILAQNYQNLGVVYRDSRDTAIKYIKLAINLYRSQRDTIQVQKMYSNIGMLWLKDSLLRQAKPYIDSAIAAYPEGVANNATLQEGIGGVNYYSGNYRAGILYLERSLAICKAQGERQEQLDNYWTLAEMYDKTGNSHKAYQYERQHSMLMDSLMDENMAKSINQQEVKYRTSEKNKELVQKQLLITRQQNKIQQQYLWLVGALFFVLVLFSLLRRKQHKAVLAELRAKLAGEEQERMRMARELHDGIVSKLSSVKMNFNALSLHTDTGEAEHFKNTLSQLEESIAELRSTSHNLLPAVLQRAGLTSAIHIYCAKIKTTTALDIDFQLIGEMPVLKPEAQLNLYRIVQELIQNIIKHAGAANALIQFLIRGNQLSITIDDDGKGMTDEKLHNENSTGLYNLRDRVKLLKGTIKIETDKGTSVYLEFSLKHLMEKK